MYVKFLKCGKYLINYWNIARVLIIPLLAWISSCPLGKLVKVQVNCIILRREKHELWDEKSE
jgi:hypothetical protein